MPHVLGEVPRKNLNNEFVIAHTKDKSQVCLVAFCKAVLIRINDIVLL